MLNPRNSWAILLALFLAGCVNNPRYRQSRAPDWQPTKNGTVTLAPSPAIAPPPTAAPAALPAVTPNPLPAAAPPVRDRQFSGTWIPLDRWCQVNNLAAPTRAASKAFAAYRLQCPQGALWLRIGSPVATWDGLELRLGYAPQFIDGQPCVHAVDVSKTLHPLLLGGPELCLTAAPVVVIDPGHGGENAGTRSTLGNHYEKEYTLDWALRLRSLLLASGCQVFLTRTNDVDLALSNRVAFAETRKADLFLSLHFNSAAPSQGEAGLETYCLTPAGLPSSLVRGFEEDASTVFPNNAFDAQNLKLAIHVHRALLQVAGRKDRGVRRARFPGVLRTQQRPAILIEAGYLSNPTEARQIADPAFRQILAEAVATGVSAGIKRPLLVAATAPAAPRGDTTNAAPRDLVTPFPTPPEPPHTPEMRSPKSEARVAPARTAAPAN